MKAYGTSTAQLMRKHAHTSNPVTKGVYKDIIGNRIDRQELFRLSTIKRFQKLDKL